LQVLPGIFLAPLGGAIADRFERRHLLVGLDAASAFLALAPLLVRDATSTWIIYLSLLLLQICANVYIPAQSAYLPELVADDLLEPANAAYITLRNIAVFIGPALAGLVIARWGTSVAFAINSLTFVVAALSLLTLPSAKSAKLRELNPRAVIGGYIDVTRRNPSIARLALCYLAGYLPISLFQGTIVAYPALLDQPTSFVGLIYGAGGLGGAIGGLVMGQYFRRLSFTRIVIIDMLSVPSLGLLVFIHSAPLFLLVLALVQVASNAGDVAYTSFVQRYVSAAERGRMFGLLSWSSSGGRLLGAGLGAAVATSVVVPALLWVSVAALPLALFGVAPLLLQQRSVGLSLSAGGTAAEGT
jgi:MFS family permease